ncbi:MAG: ROK family protein [Clostridia bacterium]|nr:ROK family protein [Clostridia bacterium]
MHQLDMALAATRPSDLKLSNRMQILELFKSGAVYSVADIAREIGISRQTVMKAIQFFLEKGIIVSDGKADSGSMGGKRAELFTLSADRYLLNVLICPSCLYISLFNFRCETIGDYTREDIVNAPVDEIMDATIAACDRLLKRHGVAKRDLRGLCLTTSGIMERGTNRLRYNSLFPEWGKDIPIAEKLAAHYGSGVAVLTENVARVCGSGYLPVSRIRHSRGVSVFTRWGGIGACMMTRGHMLCGKDSLIGEIGHMLINPADDEVCACGYRGCFERQVSVERLRTLAHKWAGECPDSELASDIDGMTIPGMFEASAKGDPLARRLSEYAATQFAAALRNVTLTYNPTAVVFQGDYAFADEHFRATLFKELRAFKYFAATGAEDEPFVLKMDTRSIQELSTLGAYTLLIDRLFCDEAMYL